MSSYLMEHRREAERLEAKTDREVTRRHVDLLAIPVGARVLEAGAGTGAVSRYFSEVVGPTGQVVALDQSVERLEAGARLAREAGLGNVLFVAGDVCGPPLREGSFDLVWSRFLFGYLPDPDRALASLVRITRPGGRICVGEVDGHGLFHWPLPAAVSEKLPRFEAALAGVFDPYAGRKLYHRFRRAGLRQIEVHVLPYHLYTDSFPEEQKLNWGLKLENLRPVGVRAMGEEAWEAFARDYMAMLQDPDVLTYSVVHFVEGIRPA